MKNLIAAFITIMTASSAYAQVTPAQWLENCLAQPVPELDAVQTEIFIQNADIECLSSFPVVCKGFEDIGICTAEGSAFLDTAFDAAVAHFPDFSAEDSSFLKRRYQALVNASSADPLEPIEGCAMPGAQCDYLGRAMRLIDIRQASRAIENRY